MFTNDLYKTALCNPAKGNSSLYIVSGYSSATFTNRHLKDLNAVNNNIDVNLIIGMQMKRNDHQAYLNLKQKYKKLLNIYYIENTPDVHVKAYAWLGDYPIGFSGSANYSVQAFLGSQINQLKQTDPNMIKNLFDTLLPRTTPIQAYKTTHQTVTSTIAQPSGSVPPGEIQWLVPGVSVRISFLNRKGIVPEASGLNWGWGTASKNKNKPNDARKRNDTYLSIKSDATDEGFLPDKDFTFTLVADDGFSMDCKVQQQGRKAVTSTNSNQILGEYLRKRFGLKSGQFITTKDLNAYGRTDFTLTKVDDENFELDVSVYKNTSSGMLRQKIMIDPNSFNQ